jgi:hypothetical protein
MICAVGEKLAGPENSMICIDKDQGGKDNSPASALAERSG